MGWTLNNFTLIPHFNNQTKLTNKLSFPGFLARLSWQDGASKSMIDLRQNGPWLWPGNFQVGEESLTSIALDLRV